MGRIRGNKATDSDEVKFWRLVNKTETCWLWTGTVYPCGGYGHFRPRQFVKDCRAHRYSWRLHNGEIPDGMFVCHRCDTPRCVRPDHLFLGTHQDNVRDMLSKRRERRRERHYNAKINQMIADQIRQRRQELHESYERLAVIFGVGRTTVQRVCTKASRGGWS